MRPIGELHIAVVFATSWALLGHASATGAAPATPRAEAKDLQRARATLVQRGIDKSAIRPTAVERAQAHPLVKLLQWKTLDANYEPGAPVDDSMRFPLGSGSHLTGANLDRTILLDQFSVDTAGRLTRHVDHPATEQDLREAGLDSHAELTTALQRPWLLRAKLYQFKHGRQISWDAVNTPEPGNAARIAEALPLVVAALEHDRRLGSHPVRRRPGLKDVLHDGVNSPDAVLLCAAAHDGAPTRLARAGSAELLLVPAGEVEPLLMPAQARKLSHRFPALVVAQPDAIRTATLKDLRVFGIEEPNDLHDLIHEATLAALE